MAPGIIGTEGMDWPKIKIPRLNIGDELSGALAILAGIIISMWSNCAFVVSVTGHYYFDTRSLLVVIVAFLTHLLLTYSFTSLLIQGFNKRNSNFMLPWLFLKGIETVLVFSGIIAQVCSYRPEPEIIPVAIIILVITCYLDFMMYQAWKYIKENPDPSPPTSVNIETVMNEKPPSYESFTNETNVL